MHLLIFLSSLLFGQMAFGKTYDIAAKDAVVFEAKAKALSFIPIDFEGEGGDLYGKIILDGYKAQISLWVNMADFKTGNETRDEHMLEMWEVEKYPKGKLEIKDFAVKAGKVDWEGSFEIKGVKKPVKGSSMVVVDAGKYKVEAWYQIDIQAFGIDKKDMAVVSEYVSKVEKDVKVKASFEFGG